MLFAFVAGAGTAVSPCVLPVLPAVLVGRRHGRPAAAARGGARPRRHVHGDDRGLRRPGRRRRARGLDAAHARRGRPARLRARARRAAARRAPRGAALPVAAARSRARHGDGFRSGVVVGAALGFAYAPCAGPILAAVITVGAASGRTVPIALAYAAGSACVLLALALGGRRVAGRVRRAGRGPAVQRAVGVVMVLTAVAVAADLDVRFQTRAGEPASRPRWSTRRARWSALGGRAPPGRPARPGALRRRRPRQTLPALGRAPDFTGHPALVQHAGRPRRCRSPGCAGRSCSSTSGRTRASTACARCPTSRPGASGIERDGLVVVGVHTPEFQFEHEAGNVASAIRQNRIPYPVAQDNEYATWERWGNQAWPAKYLVDARGRVRYAHIGEGEYAETEAAIRALLEEAGRERLGEWRPRARRRARVAHAHAGDVPRRGARPRLSRRAPAGCAPLSQGDGPLERHAFALSGRWRVDDESAEAVANARLDARVLGKSVYLVLGSRGDRRRARPGAPRRQADPAQSRRAPTSATAASRSPASGSTGSSRCRSRASTASPWTSTAASPGSRSPSGDAGAISWRTRRTPPGARVSAC